VYFDKKSLGDIFMNMFAREDLNHSLHEWMLAKRKFQEISESDKEISRKISEAAQDVH
jgi:hypothetical protein